MSNEWLIFCWAEKKEFVHYCCTFSYFSQTVMKISFKFHSYFSACAYTFLELVFKGVIANPHTEKCKRTQAYKHTFPIIVFVWAGVLISVWNAIHSIPLPICAHLNLISLKDWGWLNELINFNKLDCIFGDLLVCVGLSALFLRLCLTF